MVVLLADTSAKVDHILPEVSSKFYPFKTRRLDAIVSLPENLLYQKAVWVIFIWFEKPCASPKTGKKNPKPTASF